MIQPPQPMQISTEELFLIIGQLFVENFKVKQLLNESAQTSSRGMGKDERASATNNSMSRAELRS